MRWFPFWCFRSGFSFCVYFLVSFWLPNADWNHMLVTNEAYCHLFWCCGNSFTFRVWAWCSNCILRQWTDCVLMGYEGSTCGSSDRWCSAEVERCSRCGCWGTAFIDIPVERSVGTTGCHNTPSYAICGVVDHISVVVSLSLIDADTFCKSKEGVIPRFPKHRAGYLGCILFR